VPTLSYRQPGLVLLRGATANDRQVRDLQRDLRQLGYLKRGIDGDFGEQTELAVRGLQHDLLQNNGSGKDGPAPIRLTDFNHGRVGARIRVAE
jgi:peptidoglycan hydrolase-like protein with peptidoglycan-binding domain